jgi:hypothetical protein
MNEELDAAGVIDPKVAARNVHFISGLMESGVDFVAADNPHANKLMVHLLAAFDIYQSYQMRLLP